NWSIFVCPGRETRRSRLSCMTCFYTSTAKLTESDFRKLADRAAELGVEYFFIASDWDRSGRGRSTKLPATSSGEPSSFFVRPEIFPSESLRPLSDYVHARGMKFALWFNPEAVYSDW